MMPAFNQDPVSRSRGVRSSARAHLARLREDRLQKRQAASPSTHMSPAVACDPPAPVQPRSRPELAEGSAFSTSVPADAIALQAPRAAVEIGASDLEVTEPSPFEEQAAAVSEITSTDDRDDGSAVAIYAEPAPVQTQVVPPAPAEAATAPDPLSDPKAPAISESADTAEERADAAAGAQDASDLAELPGAGPGLIWLLQECGVRSLAELAAVDSADLSRKLGLVGQLLDLEHWIAYARANS